jgi:hypothetical protein
MEHLQLSAICEHLPQLETDPDNLGLFDLPLEHQVQFLDFMKNHKDVERGKCRGKGFGNCQLNRKRDPKVFTFLEAEFAKLAESYNVQLNHEVRIKVKDRLNRWYIFKLDFLEPTKMINVEISPNWHKKYLVVQRRDILRKRLLKKVGIKSLTVPATFKGIYGKKHGHIDYIRAKRILKQIESSTPSVQSLDYYLMAKGGEC